MACFSRFLSTLSVRRATLAAGFLAARDAISIHALREESDTPYARRMYYHPISIHALREESDKALDKAEQEFARISIHALREESDPPTGNFWRCSVTNFYPRSP